MAYLVRAALMATLLAGCASGPTAEPDAGLSVYTFWYGEGRMTPRDSPYPLGWMARVHNEGSEPVSYTMAATAIVDGMLGPVTRDGWQAAPEDGPVADTLGPQEARLWVFAGDRFCCHGTWLSVAVDGEEVYRWEVDTRDGGGAPVEAGMHVQTRTVGVWVNGTSFYTNIPEMIGNASFPAGFNRTAAADAADPLRVYVYDQARTEQPNRSIDTCRSTTIAGYNDLLKSQAQGVTMVRFLAPEEAYTRPGNEDHFLYGEPLVFMNTVVAIDGTTGPTDVVPDPDGACFDEERYIPDPLRPGGSGADARPARAPPV